MNTAAVVMMVLAMLVIWGGLVLSMLNLRAHPQVDDESLPDPD